MVLGKSIGRLLHTIGRVCQSAYERGKTGSAVAVLKRLPVMVLRQETKEKRPEGDSFRVIT